VGFVCQFVQQSPKNTLKSRNALGSAILQCMMGIPIAIQKYKNISRSGLMV
jgi:hypothetical protein